MAIIQLPSTFTATIVGVCFIVLYVLTTCYLNYQKCAHLPGPFLAKISPLWLFRRSFAGTIWQEGAMEIEKYGSTVRIAPGKILTSDPVLLRHMSSPRSKWTRGTWHDAIAIDPDHPNVFSTRDETLHNALRAKVIRGYSGKDIPLLETCIDNRAVELINLIRKGSEAGNAVDMARLSQYFTLDVLTEIAFEEPFGFLIKNEDVYQYIKDTSGVVVMIELQANFPLIRRILSSRIFAPLRPKPTDEEGFGAALGVAKRVVAKRYAPDAKRKDDMLGAFINSGLTQQEAEGESMVQILGGSDSTAAAIRMIFLHIVTNPLVYQRLIKELDDNKEQLTWPVIKQSESRNLPYLQACIKEGIRIWPPLVGMVSKLPPPGGETVNGIYIPEGIEVCWSALGMSRRADIFGNDADTFRPERWFEAKALDDGGKKLLEMERTNDLLFGSGKYQCLGKTIALMELDKIFVPLFQRFEWSLINVTTPVKSMTWGAHVQSEMLFRVRERDVSVME